MRARHGIALLSLAVLLAAQGATAEPLGRHFTITPFGGYTTFDGDQTFPRFYPLKDELYVGGRLGYQHNAWLGIEAAGGYTPSKEDGTGLLRVSPAPGSETAAQLDTLGGRDVDFWHISGNIMLSLWPTRYGGPFVFGGGGYSRFAVRPASTVGLTPFPMGNVEAGGGVLLWLSDAVGLRLEARDIYWIPGVSSLEKRQHLVFGGGITMAIGSNRRDSDGDGVEDKKDKCPDTPHGAKVDANGCPLDTDGDKVFDGIDQCPNTPKGCTVDAKGCPSDQDGDGVCDGLDQCADTPKGATVDANGCPKDSDGDGVLDGLDRCPDTAKGCSVDANGCPSDTDGDGICDGVDKCPGTPAGAQVDKDGCPIEVSEKETELLDTGMIRLQNVNFETAKAELLPESYPVLDEVGQVLSKWPQLQVEVGGHTDSRGAAAYNQSLSEARAHAVLDYLMQKFQTLKSGQFTVKGYGEMKPIAPNTTPLNLAKNRRVEFVVINKEVLKKEKERRRLLQRGENPAAPDTTKH